MLTLSAPLHPTASLAWDLSVAVGGFGPGGVRATIAGEYAVESESGAVKAGRVVGGGAEEGGGEAAQPFPPPPSGAFDWAAQSAQVLTPGGGGPGSAWGHLLSPMPTLPPLEGGLLWTGEALSERSSRPKPLPLQASLGVAIARAPLASDSDSGAKGTALPSTASAAAGPAAAAAPPPSSTGWSLFGLGGGGGKAKATAPRPTAAAAGALSDSPEGGEGGEGSSTPAPLPTQAEEEGMNGGAGVVGGGVEESEALGGLLEEGAGAVLRPYALKRIELACSMYRVSALGLLTPSVCPLPPSLAYALAMGCDVLPGASLGFGLAGHLSPLAASRVEGGGAWSWTAQRHSMPLAAWAAFPAPFSLAFLQGLPMRTTSLQPLRHS